MNEIRKFCIDKQLTQSMEDAFVMYCRSDYAQEYLLKRDGDTIQQVVSKMTQEQVLDAWNKFLSEMSKYLPQG